MGLDGGSTKRIRTAHCQVSGEPCTCNVTSWRSSQDRNRRIRICMQRRSLSNARRHLENFGFQVICDESCREKLWHRRSQTSGYNESLARVEKIPHRCLHKSIRDLDGPREPPTSNTSKNRARSVDDKRDGLQ